MRQPAFAIGPAALQRRTPSWGLLLTLGLHLVLLASWRTAHPPAPDTREERVFDLIPLPLPEPDRPAPRVRQAAPAVPAARTSRASPAPLAEPEPEAVTLPAEPQRPVADPFADTPAPVETPVQAMVGRAKKDAIAIDREMRKGKSGVPENPDTPWGRFVRGLEGAHRDTSLTVKTDSYTTPDGETIYRFRRGGKYYCRTSGFVRPSIGGAEGGGAQLFDSRGSEGSAGQVRCPSQAAWQRD